MLSVSRGGFKKNQNEFTKEKNKWGPEPILGAKLLLSKCFSKLLILPDCLNMATNRKNFINVASGNL